MNKSLEKKHNAVKFCANCWMCKYTRNCKKKSILYYISRLMEKFCPWCYKANKELKKDFQKSKYFDN